jgi:hypothetical protein
MQPLPARVSGAEVPGTARETWNDRVKQGRDKIPGGIHD